MCLDKGKYRSIEVCYLSNFLARLTSAVAVVELMLRTDKSVVLPPKPEIQ